MNVVDWYVPRGRISRVEFLFHYLLPLVLVDYLAGQADSALGLQTGPLADTVFWATAVPFVAAMVTRLHDFGGSAWRLLALLVPVVGWLLLAVALVFCRGDEVSNRYGPPPASLRPSRLAAAVRRRRPGADDTDVDIEARPLQPQGR